MTFIINCVFYTVYKSILLNFLLHIPPIWIICDIGS